MGVWSGHISCSIFSNGARGVPYFVINGRAILTHKSSTFSNKIRGVLHLVNYLDNGYENVKITKVNI